ncbi:MAG TPA: GIY-YIG nuclease family protein [Flavobacteriales bacterium]|jgi:putative endonuclease|nr:GIY-YIG nuclease family protein [Flavobacteriales bacterium]
MSEKKLQGQCYVYALASLTRPYIYVGLSFDTDHRISDHQNGSERTTRPYRPFRVLLIEEFPDRASARQREKYLKSGAGKEFLKQLRTLQG